VVEVAGEYDRMSVRQLYYQLVARKVIDKTEAAYKRVCDVSAQMRLDGSLDYRTIVLRKEVGISQSGRELVSFRPEIELRWRVAQRMPLLENARQPAPGLLGETDVTKHAHDPRVPRIRPISARRVDVTNPRVARIPKKESLIGARDQRWSGLSIVGVDQQVD